MNVPCERMRRCLEPVPAERRILAPRSSTTAFAKGADGEVAVAKVLDDLADHGWFALHDRLLPRGPQLDHLVTGPGGVMTVDAKRYTGALVVGRDGSLRIAGRDRSKLLTQARKQSAAITEHLTRHHGHVPPVTPVLCFVGTEMPRRHLTIDGVHIVTRRELRKLLTNAPPILAATAVNDIAAHLAATLAPDVADQPGSATATGAPPTM